MNTKSHIYCSNCGAKNADGAKFCESCGAKIDMPIKIEGGDKSNDKSTIIVPDQSSVIDKDSRCPKCGSKNIHIGRKGYGGGKALLGLVFLGPAGLLVGQMGANTVFRKCLDCGNKF
ncbi:zinc-ribbon domain-containing protein [Candidatus Kaiserbacteria bacterium]|nr:zinc-ribbon domain-containing protein [Candidatus Kaiserbacteria bacterium]